MGTNVPLPSFGPQGFTAPSDAQILAGVQADMQAAFGGALSFSTSSGSATNPTPQGQMAASLTAILSSVYAQLINITNQVNPAFAQGRMQDAIGNIYFIERYPALGTAVQCTCTGAVGTLIPGGLVGVAPAVMAVDGAGNQYVCVEGGLIGGDGTISLPFVNVAPGPTPCAAGTLNSIYQTIPGWDSITNPDDGVIGSDVESRAAFETRRQATVEGNSFGPIGAILGAVGNVPGILDYFGFSNNTAMDKTVANVTIAAGTFYVSTAGGAPGDIANAMLSKLPAGPSMNGNTTVQAFDDNPLYDTPVPYDITFDVADPLEIAFDVVLSNGPGVPANAAALVQAAILAAFAGEDGGPRARIGSEIFASRFYSPVAAIGSWVRIVSLQIGSANDASAQFSCTISGTALTVVNLVSGSIQVGAVLFLGRVSGMPADAVARTLQGTRIVSGSGSSWVVNLTQTVAAATFTGTAGSPSTHLVVASITGTINIGDTVIGTGISSDTVVVSQFSGTTGGNGTYVVSNSNTASSASCTTAATISSASPDLNDEQVWGSQVPVTDPTLIYVTVG